MALCRPVQAGKAKTIAFIPDPTCRGDALVTEIEGTLRDHLKVKRVEVVEKEKDKASILLQYFLLVRREGDQIVVQLDGRAFENRSGKLLAESSKTSDLHADDVSGRPTAARQAARRLAEELTVTLDKALWSKGKGRQVMIQVTLEGPAGASREAVLERLKKELGEMSPRMKGSTERNLVLTIKTAERMKDLVEIVEKALTGPDELKVSWIVQSDNALIGTLKAGKK